MDSENHWTRMQSNLVRLVRLNFDLNHEWLFVAGPYRLGALRRRRGRSTEWPECLGPICGRRYGPSRVTAVLMMMTKDSFGGGDTIIAGSP
jgi:hypothetical protein